MTKAIPAITLFIGATTLAAPSKEPFKLGTFVSRGEELVGIVLCDRYVVASPCGPT